MAAYIEQPRTEDEREAAGLNDPKRQVSYEWQLRRHHDKEKREKEAKEAKEKAEREAAEREAAEIRAAAEAARPRPTGPSMTEFYALVGQASDSQAKLGLLKARAADCFKQGFPEEAANLYTSALNLNVQPTHALHSNRSACRCGSGDYEGALEDALLCLRLSKDAYVKGFARKGAALHGLCKFDEAVRAYEEGLKREPGNAALEEGLADAQRRIIAAGGKWDILVDGAIERAHTSKDGEVRGPTLGCAVRDDEKAAQAAAGGGLPLSVLCAGPEGHLVAADGSRPKLFSDRHGDHVLREFNTAHVGSGAKTFSEAPSGLAVDVTGLDPALYAVLPSSGRLYRLKVRDTRSMGARKEEPDKIMKEVSGKRVLGLDGPRGLALVDTSRMGGGGCERTLYLCDTGNARVLALEPKELEPMFEVGRKGHAAGELAAPVSVCACDDHLAVADAGNWRVALFTLRGTFVRNLGERASRHASKPRAGHFMRPPAHVAMAPGCLFVLEEAGRVVHVLSPQTGEPLGMLVPPFNMRTPRDAKGALDVASAVGALDSLCVAADALYVGSTAGRPHAHPRILRLVRQAHAAADEAKPAAPPAAPPPLPPLAEESAHASAPEASPPVDVG